MTHFDGKTYNHELDHGRLKRQLNLVFDLMIDGEWRTLFEIENIISEPQASISARLRDLRKPRFGSYVVERKRRSKGLFEYRVSKPVVKMVQQELWLVI